MKRKTVRIFAGSFFGFTAALLFIFISNSDFGTITTILFVVAYLVFAVLVNVFINYLMNKKEEKERIEEEDERKD